MAESTDPFTNLYLDHAAIRRDIAVDTSELMKEGLKESYNTRGDVKDSRFDIASRINGSQAELSRQVDAIDDTLSAQLVTISRESADNRAQIMALGFQVRDGNNALGKDVELNALKGMLDAQKNVALLQLEAAKNATALQLEMAKNAAAVALGQAGISKDIAIDGEKTRSLINDHKYHDLSRHLIERESALVELASENRHWHHRYDDARWAGNRDQFASQFSALQSTMQNFNSQLSETRQGMTNFGTMAGVGQSSTANSVR